MKDASVRSFGLLIAYVIPGLIGIEGPRFLSDPTAAWLEITAAAAQPTIAGFLYTTVAAIGMGMAFSSIRWNIIDTIHAHFGLKRPAWNDQALEQKLHAYQKLVDLHYHYYLFHANSIVASIFALAVHRYAQPDATPLIEIAGLVLCVMFWRTGRDNLTHYYTRTDDLLKG